MAVGDILRASLLYSVKGEKCANVLHFKEIDDPGADNERLLGEAIANDLWGTPLRACVSNDCTLQMVRVSRIDPTVGGPINVAVDNHGTVTEDTLPPNSTVLLSLYSARLDRAGRGRMFIPGVPKTFNQDGLLPQSAVSTFNTFADLLLVNLSNSGGQWTPGVWSVTHSEFNQFVSYELRSWIHTLRGRRNAAP